MRRCVELPRLLLTAVLNCASSRVSLGGANVRRCVRLTGLVVWQVATELSDRLGLGALLQKIDKVFCKHLNDHWVPQEVAAIDKEKNGIPCTYLSARGSLPSDLNACTSLY